VLVRVRVRRSQEGLGLGDSRGVRVSRVLMKRTSTMKDNLSNNLKENMYVVHLHSKSK